MSTLAVLLLLLAALGAAALAAAERRRRLKLEEKIRDVVTAAGGADGDLGEAFDRLRAESAAAAEKCGAVEKRSQEMIAQIAHDLRTPLSSLLGRVEMLAVRDAALSPERRDELLQTALRSAQLLVKTVNELFDVSRLRQGVLVPRLAALPVLQLIEEIAFQYQSYAESKGVTLEIRSRLSDRPCCGDYGLLLRAAGNVVRNAVYYTPAGGRVDLEFAQTEGGLRMVVSDTGIGIPAEDLPHVFERFYRVNKDRSRETGGTGLGLAIAKEIIEAHGGRIEIKSELGQGTRVTVDLPAGGRPGEGIAG